MYAEGSSVHEHKGEALASEPGGGTGEGTKDDPFTAVEPPPVNHPDVDTTKDPMIPSFMENEDAVLKRHPNLLQAIEKDSKWKTPWSGERLLRWRTLASFTIAALLFLRNGSNHLFAQCRAWPPQREKMWKEIGKACK